MLCPTLCVPLEMPIIVSIFELSQAEATSSHGARMSGDPSHLEFFGSPAWVVVGLWALPGPGGDGGTHRPSRHLVPPSLSSPQLLPETHSGTPSSVQGCAEPRWGKLPKQTSQAVPLVQSPLQGALKVFIWPLSPCPSLSKWEVHKVSPGLLLLLELSQRDRAGNMGSPSWTKGWEGIH